MAGSPTAIPRAESSRAAATRDRMVLVAMRLFAERGFDGVTVRDIAKAADVSIGLISHHFDSKEGLREAVDAVFVKRTARAIKMASAHIENAEIDLVMENQIRWIKAYKDEWPVFAAYLRRAITEKNAWSQQLFADYFNSIRDLFEQMDEVGLVHDEVDRDWLPWLYLFMLAGPLMFDPHIETLEGKSAYEPETWGRLQKAIASLLRQGINP